jgi:hypothetical protein
MAALAILTATGAQQTAKHPITFDDLIAMRRIAEAELSPDGSGWRIRPRLQTEANRMRRIWMAPVASGDASIDADGKRFVAQMVPGRKDDCVFVGAQRILGMCCRWTVAKRIR